MTKTSDWIVVGGGITGTSVSYELARQGVSVALLEPQGILSGESQGATRFSYGGLAFWAGTTALTRQLYQEGFHRHQILSQELAHNTQFRELDLLLTIPATADPEAVSHLYHTVEIVPQLLTVAQACEREPLLNPQALSGALWVKQGHICPTATTQAYGQAFLRQGGQLVKDVVINVIREGNRVRGVQTPTETYWGENVVICAGGMSRRLLQGAGVTLPLYFTHAEILETPPLSDLRLQTMIMPAQQQRWQLEETVSISPVSDQWEQPDQELAPAILDPGIVQFLDGHCRIGQISRAISNPEATVNQQESEEKLRQAIGDILPKLRDIPATCRHSIVAFSADHLPLIGTVEPGLSLFAGLSNPLVMIPALAQRFANSAVNHQPDSILEELSPRRFTNSEQRNPG